MLRGRRGICCGGAGWHKERLGAEGGKEGEGKEVLEFDSKTGAFAEVGQGPRTDFKFGELPGLRFGLFRLGLISREDDRLEGWRGIKHGLDIRDGADWLTKSWR